MLIIISSFNVVSGELPSMKVAPRLGLEFGLGLGLVLGLGEGVIFLGGHCPRTI